MKPSSEPPKMKNKAKLKVFPNERIIFYLENWKKKKMQNVGNSKLNKGTESYYMYSQKSPQPNKSIFYGSTFEDCVNTLQHFFLVTYVGFKRIGIIRPNTDL